MNIIINLLRNFDIYRDRPAISEGDRICTYGELYLESAKVAAYLSRSNIKNSCIAVKINDPIEHLIAIIGIVLSGNYYFSITEGNEAFFRAEDRLPVRLMIVSGTHDFQLLSIPISAILKENQTVITPDVDPETFICAFYTSGSTGTPKVVIHKHKTIYFESIQEIAENDITCEDKVDLVFSMSFSASISCIFPTLLAGAEICVFRLKELGIQQLTAFWEKKAITFSTLSVSTFQAISKSVTTLRHLEALRFVCISAEPLKNTTVGYFREKFPRTCVLQIAYATTETRTISDIKLRNDAVDDIAAGYIGKPCHGKKIMIMNADGQPATEGSRGEIIVESLYMADSYFGQPADISNPFSRHGNLIRYRTGDMGYVDEAGNLYYTGRKHNNIKLNGIRISIAAIESETERIQGILQAVAIINRSGEQEKLVCLYKTDGTAIDEAHMREHIMQNLPPSHVPHFFSRVADFPLTHSGKVDRKALEDNNVTAPVIIPKHTERYEATIIDIFKKVLGNPLIDESSHFFQLGGDSLSTLVCVSELTQQLKIKILPSALLSAPTPAELSRLLASAAHTRPRLVTTVELNMHTAGRKQLYLIHRTMETAYKQLVNSELSLHFNITGIYFDIVDIHQKGVPYDMLIDELCSIIGATDDSVVLGSSFNGYVAHQLACRLTQISCCILIDTYYYFDFKKRKRGGTEMMQLIYRQTIREKDFGLLFYLARWMFKKPFMRRYVRNVFEPFRLALNDFVAYTQLPAVHNNCIYVEASRSTIIFEHTGSNWSAHTNGDFHLLQLTGDHTSITLDHTDKIVRFIIQHTVARPGNT